MNFWKSGSGAEISGDPKKAFLPDFTLIPDGTSAIAKIESFLLVEKEGYKGPEKYYEITWRIASDDFKGRIVSQKIKVFDGKTESIDRNLNMLKLIMDLCLFKPKHADAPTNSDLLPMISKSLGIKIREWSVPKSDGSGFIEGNNVSEVHPLSGFSPVIGEKLEVIHTPSYGVDSALTRNSNNKLRGSLNDIPF